MEEKFRKKIKKRTNKTKSKLILAMDVKKEEKCLNIMEKTKEHILGVKIGYPLILNTNIRIISKIKQKTNVPIIADFKIADIPSVSKKIAKTAFKAGAHAVITHGFTGEDSVKKVIETAKQNKAGTFIVSNMSHPGSSKFISPATNELIKLAQKTKATGIIGPATRPKEVKQMRKKAGSKLLILTPGIGAQGGEPGDAIKSGADFEIVGRAIYNSKNPKKSAKKIKKKINNKIEE